MLFSAAPDPRRASLPHLGMSRSPVLRSGRKYMQTDVRIFTDWDDPFGGSAKSALVTYWFLKCSRKRPGIAPGLPINPRMKLRR